MEEVLAALYKIQKDLDEQKTSIAKSANTITGKVTENIKEMLDTNFRTWEENQEKLKEQIENQEKRLHFLEKHARQRNIVFFGIEENEKSYSHLESNVIAFIFKYFSINLNSNDIQEARRLGKKSDNPRPITVTLTTLGTKIKIIKQKGMLKDTAYYIKEDYPQHILEKRKILQEQVKIEQEKGNKVVIKYDKLIILQNKTKTGPTQDNRKRNFSISPQSNTTSEDTLIRSTQVAKKNKTLVTRTTPSRSSSFSEVVVKPGILNYLVDKSGKNVEQDNKNKTNSII